VACLSGYLPRSLSFVSRVLSETCRTPPKSERHPMMSNSVETFWLRHRPNIDWPHVAPKEASSSLLRVGVQPYASLPTTDRTPNRTRAATHPSPTLRRRASTTRCPIPVKGSPPAWSLQHYTKLRR